jgi:hypothetical protein
LTLFAALIGAGSFFAGLLGALTGLGGGIVVVPMLTLIFHVDLRYAVGASLVSVIATSSGSAAAYVRQGFVNLRVGVFLEVATVIGAVVGAMLAGMISTHALSLLFGLVLLYTAYRSLRGHGGDDVHDAPPHPLAVRLRLNSSLPTPAGPQPYTVQHVPQGFLMMLLAGVLSALLGIGSGVLKVLAMDHLMKLPFKVSTTTSNFMIGVTAAASAGVYLHRGYIDPALAFPVMLGVLAGALLGARLLARANVRWLRIIFTAVVVVMAIEMLSKGARGGV